MSLVWNALKFPREVTTEGTSGLLQTFAAEPGGRRSLFSERPPVVVETVLSQQSVVWRVGSSSSRLARLEHGSGTYLPGLSWQPAERLELVSRHAVELRVVGAERLMATDRAEASARRLLAVSRELGQKESVCVQWQIGPWVARSPIRPVRSVNKSEAHTIWNILELGYPERDSEQVAAARRKIDEPVFACVGRIAVVAASKARAHALVAAVAGAMQLMRSPGVGVSRRAVPSWLAVRRMNRFYVPPIDPPCRLTAAELAGLLGWPIGAPVLPGVSYVSSRAQPLDERVVIPAGVATAGDRVLGAASHPSQSGTSGQSGALAVLRSSDSTRHLHVIGPSGVGKSTLLAQLVLSDVAAGRSVVCIDPKGDLVSDIVCRVPSEHRQRLAVLDPSDEAPIGFNPLEGGAVGIDGVVSVLRSIWSDSWGPRLGDVLLAGLLTLAASPGHTIVELPLLLTDAGFRRPLVARAIRKDPLGLGTFWPWYESLSPEMRGQVLGPVMSRMRALLLRPDLRAVLGQAKPRFDLRSIFTDRRVLLVRLPKGQLGSDGSQLLGSLLMAHLWRLIQQRSAVPAERRHVVSLVLDEFHEFIRLPIDLPDALVQARGLGVGLTLAHQHLGQLDSAVRSAVLGNAGSRVIFRTDFDDAAVLAKRTAGTLSADDLMGLDAYEAYAQITRNGAAHPYGSIRTRPLTKPFSGSGDVDDVGGLRGIRATSQERFGVNRSETEGRLLALIEGGQTTGKRRGQPHLGSRQLPKEPR